MVVNATNMNIGKIVDYFKKKKPSQLSGDNIAKDLNKLTGTTPKTFQASSKHGKPSLVKKISHNLGGGKVKQGVSTSFVGKAYRGVKKVAGVVGKVVKKTYSAIRNTIKFAYKATKAVVKKFWNASKIVGNMAATAAKGIAVGAIRGVKTVAKGVKKVGGLVKQGKFKDIAKVSAKGTMTALNSTSMIVTKLQFRVIKFIGKKIWKGLKKLVTKAGSFFK